MKDYILNGSEALGIELGSTRIKAVLIADDCTVLASAVLIGKMNLKTDIGPITSKRFGMVFKVLMPSLTTWH